MDITQYQKDRAAELKVFRQEYTELKNKYDRLLNQAIFDNRDDLVAQILEVNTQIAQHVREFVDQSQGKFDPQTISDLTQEIIRYQREYEEVKSSQDRKKTFQKILNKRTHQLYEARNEFNFFLSLLLSAIAFIVLMIFVTPSTPLIPTEDFQSPSISIPEMNEVLGGMIRGLTRNV